MACNVYIWYDNNQPFYVGIGGETRLNHPKRNKWATNRRKKSEERGNFRQEVILTASRKNCSEVEKLLIRTYGRVSEGGLLFNFTLGGDGGDTYSMQSAKRKEEIKRKRKVNTPPESFSLGGKAGGVRAAEINKTRGNGPWDPNWVKKGTEASVKSRLENPDEWREISIKGAQSSWKGDSGVRHREINAAACAGTGKNNRGSRTITNGEIEKKLFPGEAMPEGYYHGRLKRRWVNNGFKERQCLASGPIPEGFLEGRLPR
jgi:hypothetical protein